MAIGPNPSNLIRVMPAKGRDHGFGISTAIVRIALAPLRLWEGAIGGPLVRGRH
jgi:hypothetical protein